MELTLIAKFPLSPTSALVQQIVDAYRHGCNDVQQATYRSMQTLFGLRPKMVQLLPKAVMARYKRMAANRNPWRHWKIPFMIRRCPL
jgi:hypothetical protein